ncbi:hypothetical protein [Paenibacillus sp. ISL-20]|uniref:hypothetical protein n=1 Tax=Paenibacillus sp. ISL-20 TaxID=2819163 RepID=UPI001BEC06B0|nr:hypothetical protein [Paenibacillus sp. ISL-20]MBT2765793.1 hypothetical protein [Paenibacillus sp. ISL-20]
MVCYDQRLRLKFPMCLEKNVRSYSYNMEETANQIASGFVSNDRKISSEQSMQIFWEGFFTVEVASRARHLATN